ncbi:tetratricopeptide repeat protein [bacterium]|nr:tetratricopeptide repeat protein [bacterium]
MVFMGACLLLLQPGFAYKGAYGWVTLQYPLALIAVVLLEPMLQKISPKMMKWALPAVLLLCSAAGIYRFRFFSPYQYAESSLPFYSSTNEIGSNNGDYLNMGGISAVLTYHQEHPDDTLGLNFELPVFLRDISTQKIPYEKKDLRKYDMGIFSRAALTIQEQASPSFPPENVEEAQLYRGISMAVAAPPQGVIAKAYKILYSRNTGQAVADFKELRDSFPNNIQVWYGLARAQFRFNKWDDALQSCQLGLINLPGHWGLSVLVGEVYRKQNKNEKAIQQWRKTLKMRPDKSRNYWLMGEYHYRSDSLEKAEVELIKAVSCGDAMSQRAAKTLQAIDSIRTIPAFANGLENYFINELNAIENPDEKQFAHLDRLIERMKFYMDLDSTNALLKSHLGIAFMMKGDFPHAAIAFEKAIELNPNYPQMRQYLAMARINWGAQKFEEDSLQAAVFHFRYALDYEPDNENARSNLSVAYNELAKKAMEEDDLETAYAIIRAAIFYNQKNPESFNQMGDLQLRINQADSAEIAYNQAYLLDKNNVETLRRLIDFYKDRNEPYKVNVYSKRLDELERRNKRGLLK